MCESLDLIALGIPPRSRLYHIKPIGVGTPFVESLSGYVARLALAHHVTPKSLISYEILPFQGKDGKTLRHYYRLNKFWIESASSLNGVGPTAEEWVQTLQSLTLCDNLRFSTMLTWRKVVALNRLSRGSKAWCPNCYEEWKSRGHVIYEPLLWTIESVSVCPVHHCCLRTECPYEDCKSKESVLTQVSRPGYCSQCNRWLGASSIEGVSVNDTTFDINHQKQQIWIANAVGELIAAAPTLQIPPEKEQIASTITACVTGIANGNMSALARMVDVSVQTIWAFKYQGKIPYFGTLLHICYRWSISPLEFLIKDASSQLVLEKSAKAEDAPILATGRGKHLNSDDIEKIRLVLEAELAKNEPPYSTLVEIAKMLGCSVNTLHNRCPELCRAITSKHSKKLTTDGLKKMRKALEEMLLAETPPTLQDAGRMFGYSAEVLQNHFPDLTQEMVMKYQEKNSFTNVQKYLLKALEDNTEPHLSVKAIARNSGFSISVMQTRCPDLCRKVSERYNEYLHMRHEARISVLREEVRQTVLTLHKQGIYPSGRKVGLHLSNPKLILTKEIHELWQNMLIELGWKT